MSTSVTVGMLAASALSIGAEAALRGAMTESVKDAYNTLKRRIAFLAKSDVESLENEPESIGRKAVVAEVIDRQDSNALIEIKKLAITLT
ncbi:MAG: hypothetical protein AAFY56_04655, partial [Pseudomonadota bacterium]